MNLITDFSQTGKYRTQLFPVSYYKCNIRDNSMLKELLVDKIVENAKELKNNIPNGWITNKLMTSFGGEKPGKEIFFGEDRYFQAILEKKYGECLDKFFDDFYEIAVDDIWYNCYTEGEYQEQHDHVGNIFAPSTFSCIHFLSFNKEIHKPVAFYDPIEDLRTGTSLEFGSHKYESVYFADINEGDFIMFPSYLKHSVYPSPHTPDYPRITIALNLQVIKYGNHTLIQY